uniref:Uncharacterized protein n=1 Tax=Tanacetum cinerariifolium TaxID=118510 RepID=A0A699JIH7_TANCI|nr:hypothetical protein [Tanacetum cinerariifolium]
MKNVADEAVYKKLDDSLVRATTTTSSLEAEQDSGNINKTQSKATPNESSSQGIDSDGGPSCQDTIRDTISQTRVLDLEKTKTTQALKWRKIHDIDADEDITLVNDQDNEQMFKVNDLQGKEVFVQEDVADKEVTDKVQKVVEGEVEDINTAKLIVDVAQVNVAGEVNAARIAITISATATITTEEVTLAKALVELKASKPKVKGVFFIQDPNEYLTTTISSKKSQDKGNAIMVEEPVKPKKKD